MPAYIMRTHNLQEHHPYLGPVLLSSCTTPISPSTTASPSDQAIPLLYALPTPPQERVLDLGSPASSSSSSARSFDRDPSSPLRRSSSPSSCSPTVGRSGQHTEHLKDFVVGSDESEALLKRGLVVDDRSQMQEFMSYATKAADCEMAAEVVNLLIPRNESSTPMKRHCTEKDRLQLQRYILYWTSLTPHSLCVLISTIILLERLKKRHPGLSATGQLHDTTLRVVFSAYLIAMKLCTEASYLNQAFMDRTPWALSEINAMERELLAHLSWKVYIPAHEILRRATAFWHEREDTDARQWRDDGGLDIQAHLGQNLFFMRSNFS